MKQECSESCPNDKEEISPVIDSSIRKEIISINKELSKLRHCPPRSYVDQRGPGYYSIGTQYKCGRKKGKLVYKRCEGCPGE